MRDGHFYDNGHYIGHDEPNVGFFSNKAGSGDNVNWTYTLPKDPTAAVTVKAPGKDVSNWFELTVATWLSMALCDGNSYPQLPCTPQSDANAPACFGTGCPQASYPGAGSAFLEMQFYPPGDAPFIENVSCDNTHWCASLHINEAECTFNFVSCNNNCRETTNFAFIQTNGVPTGPPSSVTPNSRGGSWPTRARRVQTVIPLPVLDNEYLLSRTGSGFSIPASGVAQRGWSRRSRTS